MPPREDTIRLAPHLSTHFLLLLTGLAALPPATARAQDAHPDARALGIPLNGTPGKWNAITDVAGVEVGHTTIIRGNGALVVGQGPVRTGVTAILPRGRTSGDSAFAGWFSLNGNGEMTGTTWIEEGGILETPILITNTHSVGVARDALIDWMRRRNPDFLWALPVVAETYDGTLNDINGFHVKPTDVFAALDSAASGPVLQGAVGGGTGMSCLGFKGGIGSSSRVLTAGQGGYTVGVLVQCNQGARRDLLIAGVPVGKMLAEPRTCYADRSVPDSLRYPGLPWCTAADSVYITWGTAAPPPVGAGSIIIVLATDAPLLPTQVKRLVRRTALGLARMGGMAYNGSGDIFIGFSTANRAGVSEKDSVATIAMLPNDRMNPLILASVYATEEAILNAMLAAKTMTGANGYTLPALPHAQVKAIMARAQAGQTAE